MKNEWIKIKPKIYNNHMLDNNVKQIQTLNIIMKNQIEKYNPRNLLILGIATGNGLEYCKNIESVICIDINKSFIKTCINKTKDYKNIKLYCKNIDDYDFDDFSSDLIIGNLILEYIDNEKIIKKSYKNLNENGIISFVIQKNTIC